MNEIKQLSVSRTFWVNKHSGIGEVSRFMDGLAKEPIAISPWPEYDSTARASFAISYSEGCLLLKYDVTEETIRAAHHATNSPVYEDTCVEFFIAFGNDAQYYNFEFNCIGTCLAGYGGTRTSRTLLPEQLIDRVGRQSLLKKVHADDRFKWHWELTLSIPFEVFCYHEIISLKNETCRMNFYKCGDALPKPHYLVWNNIRSAEPNFHLSEFFGQVAFI